MSVITLAATTASHDHAALELPVGAAVPPVSTETIGVGTLTGTVTVEGADGGVVPPPGGVPVTTAVLISCPAFTSAAVVTYVAVQITDAPGARVAAAGGQVIGDSWPVPVKSVSVTVGFVIVTLPMFVTVNE